MKGMKYPGHRGGVLFLMVALAVIGVLVLSQGATVWATPNQDALRETIPTPVAGGYVATVTRTSVPIKIEAPALGATIDVPPLAVPATYEGQPIVKAINIAINPVPPADVPKPPVGKSLVLAFNMDAYEGLDARPGIIFDKPLIITFKVTAAQLAAANGDITKIAVQVYDKTLNIWVDLPTTYDLVAGTVSATVQHFSVFALVVPEVLLAPTPTLAPGVLTPTPTAIVVPGDFAPSSGLLIGLLLLGFSLVFAGVYYFRRAWAQGK